MAKCKVCNKFISFYAKRCWKHEAQHRSNYIKQLWKKGIYKNRDQSYRTEEWKEKVRKTLKQRWQDGVFTKERNNKISKAHKGKYFGKRGRKDYNHTCIVCQDEFVTKSQSRTVCDKPECQRTYPLLRKINKLTERLRRIKISKRLKGKIPENLLTNIKNNNSFRQYEMYKIIKKYFSTAKRNYYLKTSTKRFLDVAIPELKIDFEYNGKVHLMKNVKINDIKRTKELQKIGWKVVVIDRHNFNRLPEIINIFKDNGDIE